MFPSHDLGGKGGDVTIYGGTGLPQKDGIVRIGRLVGDNQDTLLIKGRQSTHQYGSDTGSMFENWISTNTDGAEKIRIVELRYDRPSGSNDPFTQTLVTKYPTRFVSASSYFFSGSVTASGAVKVNDLIIDYDALPTSDSGLERGQVYRNGSGQLFVSAGS